MTEQPEWLKPAEARQLAEALQKTQEVFPLPPEKGWQPDDFPQLTIDHIPYTSNPNIRPDPNLQITAEGWLYIETGGHRIAIPDREEWAKLTHIGECTWNDYERVLHALRTPPPVQGDPNGHDEADAG